MLGQSQILPYFDRCGDDPIAIEEVLNAYIIWKLLKGSSCSHVLMKMHYLCIYLRVMGRSRILQVGHEAFTVTALEIALGCGRIGVSPTMTPLGIELFNLIRRAASKPPLLSPRLRPRIATDPSYGGPVPAPHFLSPAQYDRPRLASVLHASGGPRADDDSGRSERYFLARQFGTLGVPAYTLGAPDYTSWRGTLPLYASREERESVRAELESVVRELDEVSREGAEVDLTSTER